MAFRDLPASSQDPSAPRVDTPSASTPSASASSSASPPSSSSTPSPAEPPVKFSSLYPPRREMQAYLEAYARTFGLYKHIRFHTTVTRLHHSPQQAPADGDAVEAEQRHGGGKARRRQWTLRSRSASAQVDGGEEQEEEFDHVCVANGHYADAWTPEVKGLRYVLLLLLLPLTSGTCVRCRTDYRPA